MNNLTNIIEAIVFASGEAVPVKFIVEKLGCGIKEVNASIDELKKDTARTAAFNCLFLTESFSLPLIPSINSRFQRCLYLLKKRNLQKPFWNARQ